MYFSSRRRIVLRRTRGPAGGNRQRSSPSSSAGDGPHGRPGREGLIMASVADKHVRPTCESGTNVRALSPALGAASCTLPDTRLRENLAVKGWATVKTRRAVRRRVRRVRRRVRRVRRSAAAAAAVPAASTPPPPPPPPLRGGLSSASLTLMVRPSNSSPFISVMAFVAPSSLEKVTNPKPRSGRSPGR